MKKFFKILIILVAMTLEIAHVDAISVSKNNLTLEKGKSETIDIYANLEKEVTSIEFTLVYTTYDVPAFFTVNGAYTDSNPDGIKHTITLSEPTSGKIKLGTVKINVVASPKDTAGTINIHSASAKNETETIKLNSQNINVTINKPAENNQNQTNNNGNNTDNNDNKVTNNNTNNNDNTTNSNTNNNQGNTKPKEEEKKPEENQEETKKEHLLEKIESKIVKIELLENVFEYEVTVKKEITELDLTAVAKDAKTKIEISNQKLSELKDNNITIKVTKDKEEQEYKIKVNILKEVEDIKVDKESSNNNTYNYKGKWIVAIVFLGVMMFAGMILSRRK